MVLAGVSAGGIATIVSNPLDLIKTRQQAMASATMADVGREVMREEGFLGLWKVRVLSIAVRPLHLCVCPCASQSHQNICFQTCAGYF